MKPHIRVAAAIVLRTRIENGTPVQEYLLACRPSDKVYAGYWEFPGGKLEAGEDWYTALVREITEELGIHITAAEETLLCAHDYPHAHVELQFFRVTAWQGDITPLEHSAIAWTALGSEPSVSPLLPANTEILRSLTTPTEA